MSEHPLLIGSGNVDKAAELQHLLDGLPWRVLTLRDFHSVEEPDESGDTFEENATIKAEYYGNTFGVACIADDSGLAVDALKGAPGVYSARYAGPDCTYGDNNYKLIQEMKTVRAADRGARFICVAAFFAPGAGVHLERGEVPGTIAEEERGLNGFGYDPLFIPEGKLQTFGEMTAAEKHALSHRGRAFVKLRAYLETLR